MFEGLGAIIGFAFFAVLGFLIVYFLRKHGIESCENRGGIPIVRSWLNPNTWDVSCIHLPKGQP